MNFQLELEHLINRCSRENGSNTPDFILAEYLTRCLDTFNQTVNTRETWYGREPKLLPVGGNDPSDPPIPGAVAPHGLVVVTGSEIIPPDDSSKDY